MFNAWRNFFVDPESGLPWATVMMFPWLKYGMKTQQKPKVAVKIPETMKKTVSSSIKKSVKKEVKKEVKPVVKKEVKKTTAAKPSEKTLPVKAPATSLMVVEKKLPAVKTEVKKTAEKPAAAKKVEPKKAVAKPVAKTEPKKVEPKKEAVKPAVKAEPKKVEPKKEVAKPAVKAEPKKVEPKKAVAKPAVKAETKKELVKTVVKAEDKKTAVKLVETLPLDLPTPSKKTESPKKKATTNNEEHTPLVIVERKFTPINTDKLPVKEQNLITQTNPNSPKAQIREAIVLLCADWAEPAALAEVLKYKTTQLETLHLTPMVNSGQLLLRYPQDLTHPEQAYRAVSAKKSK